MQTRWMAARRHCPICFDPIDTSASLDRCPHIFCLECITRWAKHENSCPLCKVRFGAISTFSTRPNYTGRKQSRVRTRVEWRNQSERQSLSESVSSIEGHQFWNMEGELRLLRVLLQLDRDLDQLL